MYVLVDIESWAELSWAEEINEFAIDVDRVSFVKVSGGKRYREREREATTTTELYYYTCTN